MKEIQLTRGKVAIVDDEDYELVSKYKWQAFFDGNNWYARTTFRVGVNKRKGASMHRLIMNPTSPKLRVDHKNHDGLDNTRGNLRIGTSSQNSMNRKKSANNTSIFKGVFREGYRFRACIRIENRKLINLGSFRGGACAQILAALAYDEAAEKYFGEFAYLNFPKV